VAEDRLILLYDGDCVFCERLARWVERRDAAGRVAVRAGQGGGAEAVGLTQAEAARAAWAVEPGGRRFEGAAAISRVLRELGGGWAMLGALYAFAPLRWLEDRYYRRVARRRAWW
jgi:predicted DCC family thiol-disulfide oxidoreductase YuxK